MSISTEGLIGKFKVESNDNLHLIFSSEESALAFSASCGILSARGENKKAYLSKTSTKWELNFIPSQQGALSEIIDIDAVPVLATDRGLIGKFRVEANGNLHLIFDSEESALSFSNSCGVLSARGENKKPYLSKATNKWELNFIPSQQEALSRVINIDTVPTHTVDAGSDLGGPTPPTQTPPANAMLMLVNDPNLAQRRRILREQEEAAAEQDRQRIQQQILEEELREAEIMAAINNDNRPALNFR